MLTAVQPVETAIEEGMRGGTMIVELQKTHAASCERLGVSFAYGTPTEGHARLGKRRLGYIDLSALPLFRKHLNARLPAVGFLGGPFRALYQKSAAVRRGSIRPGADAEGRSITVERQLVDEQFDDLWQRLSPQYDVIAVRDARHLKWRYFERSTGSEKLCLTANINGQLAGYLILALTRKRSKRIGIVADILVPRSGQLAEDLLGHAEKVCLAEGVDYMQAAALPHMDLYETLLQCGFLKEREAKSIVCVPFSSVDRPLFDDPTRWYFTLGDFDFDEE